VGQNLERALWMRRIFQKGAFVLSGYKFDGRGKPKSLETRILVEFLFERRIVSLLPLDALGAIEVSPIHLFHVLMRPLAHAKMRPQNVVSSSTTVDQGGPGRLVLRTMSP
jgi:hypothetical protein